MKKFLIVLGVVLVAGGAFAMSDIYVAGKWRYKITVEVETPEGIKSGSAVREVSNSSSDIKILDLPDVGNPAKIKGEAVVVDLGKRGVLFTTAGSYSELYSAFPYNNGKGGETTVDGIKYYNTLKPGMKADLPKKQWPQFVTFTDMNDPKSVKLVRGYVFNSEIQRSVLEDHFEEMFGDGVRLKGITIEITGEKVTWGIEKYLGKLHAIGSYEFVKGEPK